MKLKLDQMLGMRPKIIILTIAATLIPLLIMVGLSIRMQQAIADDVREDLRQLALLNALQISRDVTSMCRTTHELMLGKLGSDLLTARTVLKEYGPARLSGDTIPLEITNDRTGQTSRVQLPVLILGSTRIEPEVSLNRVVPVVDRVRQLTGEQCSLCLRLNEAGDMCRVATSVEKTGARFVGSGISAIDAAGKPSPMIAKVLAGQTYRGPSTQLGEMYIATYDPIRDGSGRVIGMMIIGHRLDSHQVIRRALRSIQVGKTGYVAVLGGSGFQRGRYIVSRGGARDGESVWNDKVGGEVIRRVIQRGVQLKPDEHFIDRYVWRNPGESQPRAKMAVVSYFEPWDWVVSATLYEDDYFALERRLQDQIGELNRILALAGLLLLVLAGAAAFWLGTRLTQPVTGLAGLAREVAAGASQAGVMEMETTMRQLRDATGSIAAKLSAINEEAIHIGTIVSTINKVADQTNLLSLNAAIEAEKAGEYGAGFSVVAREIRRRAAQTAVATLNIDRMVKEMHTAVSSGVMEMDNFVQRVRHGVAEVGRIGEHLARITTEVQALTPRFAEVREGMGAQCTGAEQIAQAMAQLSEGASQNKQSLREFHHATEQLTAAVQGLRQEVARFKTD